MKGDASNAFIFENFSGMYCLLAGLAKYVNVLGICPPVRPNCISQDSHNSYSRNPLLQKLFFKPVLD